MTHTVSQVLEETARKFSHYSAVRFKLDNRWMTMSWSEYRDEIFTFARGLAHCGLDFGQYVTILSQNCREWVVSDVAAITAGAVPAGIYPTSSAEQCAYIINHCRATCVIVEDQKQLDKLIAIKSQLESIKFFVMIKGKSDRDDVYSWRDILKKGSEYPLDRLKQRIAAQKPDDVATLVYTSGTTSHPKAVMLSHENLVWTARMICENEIKLSLSDSTISYLPLSHIAEQMISIHGPMYSGLTVWFAESLEKMPENLKDARPTIFFGVPRVWEKIQSKMIEKAQANSPLKKKIALWAKKVGLEHGRRMEEGMAPSIWYGLAKKLVFSKVREALGLDRCRLQVTAAAPIAYDTLNFYLSLDIPLYELYGMSECSGPATISFPGQFRVGQTGRCITEGELKIAEDGEILIRGKHVFKGYLHQPEETEQTIDAAGWLHSGDLGKINDEGYLAITGRKKNIIITAGGENIAPEMLENQLASIPGIEQAVVIGDRQKFLSALLTVSPEATLLKEVTKSKARTAGDLVNCIQFNNYVSRQVEVINQGVAKVQTVKKFTLLPNCFSESEGDLTPTMKVKRGVVISKYADTIAGHYQ